MKIPKPLQTPEMPRLEPIKFKPLRQEIKTIISDRAIDFDNKVNIELKKGWKVRAISTEVMRNCQCDEMR